MIENSLKSEARNGFFWSSIERSGVQVMQIIINIILARLLSPSDFGLVGMLAIFVSLSQSFIQSGMATGLVQKKDRNEVDYSTVFIFNIVVSVLFYLILFLSAPLISKFYHQGDLALLTRVLALILIINSGGIIQNVIMRINIDFKSIAKINIISTVISGSISIISAYNGAGVWSLVIQVLCNSFFTVLLSWIFSSWRPMLVFSGTSFMKLFGFGYKLLFASILATIFDNIYKIFIGKIFPIVELGYYTQSKQYTDSSSGTITSVVQSVSFPLLAKVQDEKEVFLRIYKQILIFTSVIIFPLMTLLAINAEPLFRVVLTDKWLPAVPYFQILCFARILYPLSAINMNGLIAVGRSDLFLKVDIIKFIIAMLIVTVAVNFSIYWVVLSSVISATLCYIVDCFYSKQLFNYGFFKQLKDIYKIIICTCIMALFLYFIRDFLKNDIIKIAVNFMLGSLIFTLFAILLKVKLNQTLKLIFNK